MTDLNSGAAAVAQDPLLRLTGYVLRRASNTTLAELNERLRPLDLRPSDVSLLLLVETYPGLTQSEACRRLEIQRGNMVPLVGALEERGFIKRRQVDGRSQGLILTRAGRSLLEKAQGIIASHEAALLERVPEEMRPMVLPILMALWNAREPGAAETSAED